MRSMKQIRLVFLALAAVLLVALALLVRKAFASAAAERSARHRAVAQRVLDEMERELTAFLRREENRPFEHYRHSYLPETALQDPRAAPVRSPLAGLPAEPFVLGYFQIRPDGTVSSPHQPDATDPADAQELADWVARLEEVVRLVWRLQENGEAAGETVPAQKAGSTVEVGSQVAQRKLPLLESYLDSLNRAASSRSRRLSKLEQTQAANVMDLESAEADDAAGRRDARQLGAAAGAAFLDVRLEPMVGRAAGGSLMVLYRTVAIDERAYRQGLLIDTGALVDWLAGRVLTGELAERATFAAEREPASVAPYVYRHRFAEPFGSVAGVLRLEELPELAGATTYLAVLSLALAAAATLGLFGLYRMVAVVVEFAERRHNFVSAVTHELKTPLTAIRMYGEMLRDGVVPDEGKRQRYYETITAETERLTRLLQNVLELARLEKDTRTMSLTAGDVGEVVAEVARMLEPHARELGFVISTEIEAGLPRVLFDRDALVQVLLNLVDNALKYARDSRPKEIAVSCRRQGDGVALAVADHGPGVAREHLGKIFEPFYRGEDELTRTTKGTGIGLALVRGLVERMGGRVTGRNAGAGGFEVVVLLAARAS